MGKDPRGGCGWMWMPWLPLLRYHRPTAGHAIPTSVRTMLLESFGCSCLWPFLGHGDSVPMFKVKVLFNVVCVFWFTPCLHVVLSHLFSGRPRPQESVSRHRSCQDCPGQLFSYMDSNSTRQYKAEARGAHRAGHNLPIHRMRYLTCSSVTSCWPWLVQAHT